MNVNDLVASYQNDIELSKAVNQLEHNSAFKTVVLDNLFNKEVILLVNQLASLNKSTSEYNEVIRKLDAISYLKNYLQQLTEAGSAAERNIREAHYLLNSDEE